MSIDILTIILALLAIAFVIFIYVLLLKLFRFRLGGAVFATMIGIIGIVLSIYSMYYLKDLLKEDYRDVDTIATYKIYDMTSVSETNTLINYIDDSKELKHIKSDKVKIFYDLQENEEPYLKKLEYWRWCFYWQECEVHLRE